MEFITEIDSGLLPVLSGVVLAIVQTMKPFVADRYKLVAVGVISLSLGCMLAMTGNPTVAEYIVQSFIYAFIIGSSASGMYSYAKKKGVEKPENPAGL